MIALTGAAAVVGECDPIPYLKSRKSRKFMGLQDDLAVVAAGKALESAERPALGERAGLYLAVGYIPFADADIAPVLEASLNEGNFDVRRFGAGGYQKAHPLLTFRCLPNMPAYHVSACFDVQGPYFVTYPGPSEFYSALEEARIALESGAIDVALVGAVAAQSNFLVRHHFARIEPPVAADQLRDVAAMLVLERDAGARTRARLEALSMTYAPPSLTQYASPGEATRESFRMEAAGTDAASLDPGLGPAGLGVALANALGTAGAFEHRLEGRDGVRAWSAWVIA